MPRIHPRLMAALLTLLLAVSGCGGGQDQAASPREGFDKQAAIAQARTQLQSPDRDTRASGCRELGNPLKIDTASCQLLRQALRHDPEAMVRRAAARALAVDEYATALPDLRMAATDDPDMFVRRDAITTLAYHRDAGSIALMDRLVRHSREDSYTKAEAIKVLGAIDTPAAGRSLCDLLRSRELSRDLDLEVLDALAGMSPTSAYDELLRVMDRRGIGVDAMSARKLREKHTGQAMAKLVKCYRQRDQMLADGFRLTGNAFLDL